jgi:hypothetical protein
MGGFFFFFFFGWGVGLPLSSQTDKREGGGYGNVVKKALFVILSGAEVGSSLNIPNLPSSKREEVDMAERT